MRRSSFHRLFIITSIEQEADIALKDQEGRAEEIEKTKDEQIKKQKDGKGEWHDGLASNSESIVRPTYILPLPMHEI